MARFGFSAGALSPSYGLAESTCAVTVPVPGVGMRHRRDGVHHRDGTPPRRHAILGEAIPGMEVRIEPYENAATEVADRELGEIAHPRHIHVLRLPRRGSRTAEEWFAQAIWATSSTAAWWSCGRAKEIITVAGRNIFPAEVERIAALVPGVRGGRGGGRRRR